MDLTSWLKKLTTGNVVFATSSPINGKIQVVEDIFGRRVVVEGLTQSGGQVKRVWARAIKEIRNWESLDPRTSAELGRMPSGRRLEIGNCLILGLGAGTLAQLLSQKWPKVKIAGVEIDPKIIEIGKKYFNLDKISNLQIIIADAAKFLSTYHLLPTTYHLAFVDLYLADKVPPQCETVDFLKSLKNLLTPKGLVVFNRLYYKDHRQKTEKFLDKLEKIFQTIRKKKVGGNLLVFAES